MSRTAASSALSLVLLCSACASITRDEVRATPLATIPLEIRNGIPMVAVTISGRPLELMIDLGGDESISLTASEANQAGISFLSATSTFENAMGERLRARRFIAPQVAIAGFAVGDIEGGESTFGTSAPPSGYIGRPILSQYLLVLDYPSRHMRFYRSGDAVALRQECGAHTFAIHVKDGVQSTATTDHGEMEFVWDTGTTHNFLHPTAAARVGIAGKEVDDSPPVATIGKLVLGDFDVAPQEFRLIPFATPAVDGYLGAGLMSGHRVCLDIKQGRGAIL